LAWPSSEGKILSGFSHGAAGITYALSKLFGITNDTSYKEAALEGLAYESSVFNVTCGNWLDLNEPLDSQSPNHKVQWCHGAPGIGLARVKMLPILNTPMIKNDIDAAISTTRQYGYTSLDHLCCGNLGRAKILLSIGQNLGQSHLVDLAKRQATTVINEARQHSNEFTLGWNVIQPTKNPGFMQGLSGIGYCLLEMAGGKSLPEVLTLSI
jgi:lantibiotic modifying enzyme